MAKQVVRSACRSCHGGCGVLVTVEDNKVVSIKGDPAHPVNRGWLCVKGKKYASITHHPDRLTDPLKKTKGGWAKISWDEALETISGAFLRIKAKYGPESVVFSYGTGRDNEAFVYRLANTFGSPNVLTAGHMCYGPRIVTGITRCGNLPVVDYEGGPECVIVWGANPLVSNPDEYKGLYLARAIQAGTKIICVDPRRSMVAKQADLWLRLRPGTDGALAWGMINVILNEGLYHKDFVAQYVHGFEEFRERAAEYPLGWAATKTGLSQEQIARAARLFATSAPAAIHWGVALEQSINCVNNISLLISLMALTGNLDRPGGSVFYPNPPVVNASQLGRHRLLNHETKAKRLGGDRFRLADYIGVINPKAVWDAVLTGQPYPVEAMFLVSTNPAVSRANSAQAMAALKKTPFLVVADFFMTPTAAQASLVLPAATWLEHDYVADLWKRHGLVSVRQKAVSVGRAKSDYWIINELGKRCTDPALWWDDLEQAWDEVLSPSGHTWAEFKKRGWLQGERRFRKYLKEGFGTPTGKVELKSSTMERFGYDPLPGYLEPPETPWSNPELAKEYPLQLITGARIPSFFHTENRQPGPLRDRRPEPLVEIHPDDAGSRGIANGDLVTISSPRGRVTMKAKVTATTRAGVVAADHGWWFPENQSGDYGWDRANIDLLTDNSYDSCDPAMGATNLRVLLCRVEKANQEQLY